MSVEKEIGVLRAMVSKFDLESFAGFFAHYIRQKPSDLGSEVMGRFDSKVKDFLYMIALNAFSDQQQRSSFEYNQGQILGFAKTLDKIKDDVRYVAPKDYKLEAVIHQLAFRNHFDNATLTYVEQDIEKIKIVFKPFDSVIATDFGLTFEQMVEIYKYSEQVTRVKYAASTAFLKSEEYLDFKRLSDSMPFGEATYPRLSAQVREALAAFEQRPHAYLLFSPEDLYEKFPRNIVDKFLEHFSFVPQEDSKVVYYSAESPFELQPIIRLSANRYLHVYQKQIPVAIYKRLYAHLSASVSLSERLHRHKDKVLEKKVSGTFRRFFDSKQAFFYENYIVGSGGEQDLLIIYKGRALIVEVKATKLRAPFRNAEMAVKRLKADFKSSIQYGYDQCKRIHDHLCSDQNFTIKDEKGRALYEVDPSRIQAVYSIVVTLERFGSLQTDLSLMLVKEHTATYPWSVYLDDLETFLLSLRQISGKGIGDLFHFLELRESLHGRIYATDELDICGAYLRDPVQFRRYCQQSDKLIVFPPSEQDIFDRLYYAKKLRFKESGLS